MAKIKHIAIRTPDPEKTAAFYKEAFGLEEAALVSGAGRFGTFVKINLRVLLPALLNGWLWVVAHVVRDFAVPLFLATSSTLMLANLIWGQWELGSMPLASAYMVVLIALVVVLVCVGRGKLGAGQEQ